MSKPKRTGSGQKKREKLNLSVILVSFTKLISGESLVLKLSVVSKKEYIACPLSPSANMNLLPNKLKERFSIPVSNRA